MARQVLKSHRRGQAQTDLQDVIGQTQQLVNLAGAAHCPDAIELRHVRYLDGQILAGHGVTKVDLAFTHERSPGLERSGITRQELPQALAAITAFA